LEEEEEEEDDDDDDDDDDIFRIISHCQSISLFQEIFKLTAVYSFRFCAEEMIHTVTFRPFVPT